MTSLNKIADGASNTIMLTEVAGRPAWWQASTLVNGRVIQGGPWAGFNTGVTFKGYTFDGKSPSGPCAVNCTNDHEVYSFHTGGAYAVFADVHVQFLSAGTSVKTLAALITRAGGETVEEYY